MLQCTRSHACLLLQHKVTNCTGMQSHRHAAPRHLHISQGLCSNSYVWRSHMLLQCLGTRRVCHRWPGGRRSSVRSLEVLGSCGHSAGLGINRAGAHVKVQNGPPLRQAVLCRDHQAGGPPGQPHIV